MKKIELSDEDAAILLQLIEERKNQKKQSEFDAKAQMEWESYKVMLAQDKGKPQ